MKSEALIATPKPMNMADRVIGQLADQLARSCLRHSDEHICEEARILLGKSLLFGLFSRYEQGYAIGQHFGRLAERALDFAIVASKGQYRENVVDRRLDFHQFWDNGDFKFKPGDSHGQLDTLRRAKVLLHNLRRELVRESIGDDNAESGRNELATLVQDCKDAWSLVLLRAEAKSIQESGTGVADELDKLRVILDDPMLSKEHVRKVGGKSVHKVLRLVHDLGTSVCGGASLKKEREVSWQEELAESQGNWQRIKVKTRSVPDVGEEYLQSIIFEDVIEAGRLGATAKDGAMDASTKFHRDRQEESRKLESEYGGNFVAFWEIVSGVGADMRYKIKYLTHAATYSEVVEAVGAKKLNSQEKSNLLIELIDEPDSTVFLAPKFVATDE